MNQDDGVYRMTSFMSFRKNGQFHTVDADTLIYAEFKTKRVMLATVLDGPHKGTVIKSVTVGDPNTRAYLRPVNVPLIALAAMAE